MKKIISLALVLFVLGLTGCEGALEEENDTPDTIAPAIEVVSSVNIEIGNDNSALPTCIVTDDSSENISCTIDDQELNFDSLGTYVVYYNAEDSSGNEAVAKEVSVTVVDTSAPVISVASSISVEVDSTSYTLPVCTVEDNSSENIDCVITDGDVDLDNIGTYVVYYNATDSSGNEAVIKEVSVIVADTLEPIFTLLPQTQTINRGELLDLLGLGLKATDAFEGDLTSLIEVNINDTSQLDEGTHSITYTVTDSSGNDRSLNISLIVEIAPINLGDTIIFDDLEIYFNSTEVQAVDNMFSDYEYAVLIEVEIKNISGDLHDLNMFSYYGFGPDGIEVNSIGAYFDLAIDYMGDMLPNAVMTGYLVFEYTGDGTYTIEFSEFFDTDYSVEVEVTQNVLTESSNTSGFEVYTPDLAFTSEMFEIGDVITFDGLEIHFRSSHVELVDNMFTDYEKAILIEVDIRNISDDVNSLNMFYHDAYGPNGLYTTSVSSFFDLSIDFMGDMLPDAVMTGYLVYEYTGDGTYTLSFSELFGEEIFVEMEVVEGTIISTSQNNDFLIYTPDITFEEQMLGYSETFIFDDLEITILSTSVQVVDNMFSDYDFAVLVEVTITNIGDESHGLNMFYHEAYGPNGLSNHNLAAYFETATDYMGDLLPGATMTGHLVYNYTGDGTYVISFSTFLGDPIYVKVTVEK